MSDALFLRWTIAATVLLIVGLVLSAFHAYLAAALLILPVLGILAVLMVIDEITRQRTN